MKTVSPERPAETKTEPPVEFEHKYLITKLPPDIDLSRHQGEDIVQGYLANGSGRNTVRLRKKGEEYFQTVKWRIGDNPAERVELECAITEEQFETWWPATVGRRLEKTRYKIPWYEHTIELDIYHGDNEGYKVAEVEFASRLEADSFIPPEWFGPDVTADGRFRNANIAKSGFPALEMIH